MAVCTFSWPFLDVGIVILILPIFEMNRLKSSVCMLRDHQMFLSVAKGADDQLELTALSWAETSQGSG